MTREEYETLKALQFGLPISSPFEVWTALINKGWIEPPTNGVAGDAARFVLTAQGEEILWWYR